MNFCFSCFHCHFVSAPWQAVRRAPIHASFVCFCLHHDSFLFKPFPSFFSSLLYFFAFFCCIVLVLFLLKPVFCNSFWSSTVFMVSVSVSLTEECFGIVNSSPQAAVRQSDRTSPQLLHPCLFKSLPETQSKPMWISVRVVYKGQESVCPISKA